MVGGRTGGCEPGRVDDAALHSTATVRYESTAAPRFGAASIRILTPAGTGGSTALTDGRRAQLSCTGGAANIRTNPGGEGTGGRLTDSCSVLLSGRLTDSCSVLLSRAQTRRTKALVGARETMRKKEFRQHGAAALRALRFWPFSLILSSHNHELVGFEACP